ncbi:hypothetical protein JCM5353_005986 [Sporobolomyces roseus]
MEVKKAQVPSASGYECVTCSASVESLYTSYFQQSNTSLLQCPHCNELEADKYLSFPLAISLLDLLLLKPPVYRHLLRNRGGNTLLDRRKHQAIETLRLAAITLSVDSLVRCVPSPAVTDIDNVKLFIQTFGYCTLETISLFISIALSAILLAHPTRLYHNPSDLLLLPLALFYSSLPTTFFLLIASIIWRSEYLPSPSLTSSPSKGIPDFTPYLSNLNLLHSNEVNSEWGKWVVSFSRAELKSGLAQVGSNRGWASEAVLRKGVGGSSAVIAVSVVLRISKRRAVAVLGLAWVIHLVLLHAIDGFIS